MSRLFDDASSQYMRASSSPVTGYPFTICCWFRTNDLANKGYLVQLRSSSTGHWASIQFRGEQTLDPVYAQIWNGSAYQALHPGVDLNTWHFCAGLFWDSGRTVWLDGNSTTNGGSYSLSGSLDQIIIGSNSASASYFSGHIANVAIYNSLLTSTQLTMLANRVPYYKVRAANLVDVFHLRGFSDPEPSRMSSRALTDYNGTTQSALHPPVLYESPDIFDYPITRGIDVYQAGAYTELQQDILRIYQAGAYAEVEQELIRLYQEGAYVEFKAIWKVLVAHGFLYAEIKNIWLIDVANAFLYAEIQDTEAVRVTQSVAEMLIRYDPPARVTQVVAEVLIREEQTPPETMTIAPVAMSKNVPIIFRM